MTPDGFVQIVDPAMSPPSAPEIERFAFLPPPDWRREAQPEAAA